jgi:hypothetical protein
MYAGARRPYKRLEAPNPFVDYDKYILNPSNFENMELIFILPDDLNLMADNYYNMMEELLLVLNENPNANIKIYRRSEIFSKTLNNEIMQYVKQLKGTKNGVSFCGKAMSNTYLFKSAKKDKYAVILKIEKISSKSTKKRVHSALTFEIKDSVELKSKPIFYIDAFCLNSNYFQKGAGVLIELLIDLGIGIGINNIQLEALPNAVNYYINQKKFVKINLNRTSGLDYLGRDYKVSNTKWIKTILSPEDISVSPKETTRARQEETPTLSEETNSAMEEVPIQFSDIGRILENNPAQIIDILQGENPENPENKIVSIEIDANEYLRRSDRIKKLPKHFEEYEMNLENIGVDEPKKRQLSLSKPNQSLRKTKRLRTVNNSRKNNLTTYLEFMKSKQIPNNQKFTSLLEKTNKIARETTQKTKKRILTK